MDFYSSHNLTEPVTFVQTQEIPYLVAVVKEVIRLLPSICYQLLRFVPAGGLTVDGRSFPAGTEVGISPIAQNRDSAVGATPPTSSARSVGSRIKRRLVTSTA